MKILIIEDEPELLISIEKYLTLNNFICDIANNIRTAREYIQTEFYDCIVLDLIMPLGSGLDLLYYLKEKQNTASVLIISAKNSLEDRVNGLELGADDYLIKPFHLSELVARIHAINRRKNFQGNDIVQFDKLLINLRDRYARTETGSIDLTKKEFDLLVYFLSNEGKVITKDSILDHLWNMESSMADNHKLIYVHIKNLRKKLMEKGTPDYFQTVYGIGYRFSLP